MIIEQRLALRIFYTVRVDALADPQLSEEQTANTIVDYGDRGVAFDGLESDTLAYGNSADRLNEVWLTLFSTEQLARLACDCVAHVLPDFENYHRQVCHREDFRCRQVVELTRACLEGQATVDQRTQSAEAALSAWGDIEEDSRFCEKGATATRVGVCKAVSVAWACWLLGCGLWLAAARACRCARPDELNWQVERTKSLLIEDFESQSCSTC